MSEKLDKYLDDLNAIFDRAIELCAGTGRNLKILSRYCKRLEGLEMIDEYMKKWPKNVKKHNM